MVGVCSLGLEGCRARAFAARGTAEVQEARECAKLRLPWQPPVLRTRACQC